MSGKLKKRCSCLSEDVTGNIKYTTEETPQKAGIMESMKKFLIAKYLIPAGMLVGGYYIGRKRLI